jgi:subtilisin family serine protease
MAGPNEGGTLILHANPGLVFTSDIQNYCGMSALDSCSAAVTSVAWDPGKKIVFHAIAAFPPGSSPRLKALSFGIDFDSTKFVLSARGTCGEFEIPGNGWPGSGTGTSQSWTTGAQTGLLTEAYWFAGYTYSEQEEDSTSVSLIPHPLQHGVFVDDAFPSEVDTIAGYGRMGFGRLGGLPCPGSSDDDAEDGQNPPADPPSGEIDPASLLADIDSIRIRLPEQTTVITLDEIRRLPRDEVDPGLVLALQQAGVTSLQSLVPAFDPGIVDRDGRPILGPDGHQLTVPHDLSRWFVLTLDHSDARSACAFLRGSGQFSHVELNGHYQLCSPNDTFFLRQWGLRNTGQDCGTSEFDINAIPAWDAFGAGASWPSEVGILDSGLTLLPSGLPGHLDIYAATSGYYPSAPWALPIDTHPSRHGTACAGLAAMTGNNGRGGAAPAWSVTIVPVRVSTPYGQITDANITAGLDFLRTTGVKIASMSFGGEGMALPTWAALQNARAAGMALVASAGNNPGWETYPAMDRRNVIAVNAFMNDGTIWDDHSLCCQTPETEFLGSNYGDWLDVTAPGGRGIMTTRDQQGSVDSYYDLSDLSSVPGQPCLMDWLHCQTDFGGTSAAAPLVAGVLGAILAKNNQLDGADAEQVLMRALTDHTQYGVGFDIYSGWGRPNLFAALQLVVPPHSVQHRTVFGTSPEPDGTGYAQLYFFPGLADGWYYFERTAYTITVPFENAYVTVPEVWGRCLASTGFRKISDGDTLTYLDEEPRYTEVVGVTASSVTLRTYLYHLRLGGQWSWFPQGLEPIFSWTELGIPLSSGVGDSNVSESPRVQPNPASGSVQLDAGVASSGSAIDVFDAGGRLMTTLTMDRGGTAVWNLRDLSGRTVPAGAYFLRCREVGTHWREKLLVVR